MREALHASSEHSSPASACGRARFRLQARVAERAGSKSARHLGVADQPSKPVVARNLLAGRYDAGLTHVHHADEHPELLRVEEYYGRSRHDLGGLRAAQAL